MAIEWRRGLKEFDCHNSSAFHRSPMLLDKGRAKRQSCPSGKSLLEHANDLSGSVRHASDRNIALQHSVPLRKRMRYAPAVSQKCTPGYHALRH
jgi:hypothetical protein